MSDEWKKPTAPPPPLFIGKKERDLVKQVNDELIEKVIGQQLLYYPVDLESTNFHELYGEAIKKTFLPPVRVFALVEFTTFETTYMPNVGVDKVWEINYYYLLYLYRFSSHLSMIFLAFQNQQKIVQISCHIQMPTQNYPSNSNRSNRSHCIHL